MNQEVADHDPATSEVPADQIRPTEAVLRTLAPALRHLEDGLRVWLDGRHVHPLPMLQRAELEGLANDLRRQSDALDVDRPLLVVMLMGGTGVGKSSLLNALAGGPIAQASFTRPTTRDPVVYYHESVRPDRLDPSLRHCRLASHDREPLAQKIIVDTPDLDSNEQANREKLQAMLPVADIVLYVGSQEKYHDQLGWELFKEQRKRRAFAFVLNKWDRCLHPGASGLRPDEDLSRDLTAEGFTDPLIFRTVAQAWIDHPNGTPPDLPPQEQFAQLRGWLELGLSRLEIEALKARGVGQLLAHLRQALEDAAPPDLAEAATRTTEAWDRVLAEEAAVYTDVLLGTLDPYQTEVEHHFSVESHTRFRGLMGWYLRMLHKVKYAGSSLRDRIPMMPRPSQRVQTPATWNLSAFLHEASRVAGERVLDRRATALANRLLVEADQRHYPLQLLSQPAADAAKLDWRQRYELALADALVEVERVCTHLTGPRRVARGGLVLLANVVPEVGFVATVILLFWRFFMEGHVPQMFDAALPFIATLGVLIVFQVLIGLLLPVRWPTVRDEFRRQLEKRLLEQLRSAFGSIPGDVAGVLAEERRRATELATEVGAVADWLGKREQAASIAGLYGN